MESIVFLALYVLFLTCAFHGLLGAVYRHLRLPTRLVDPGGFPLKTYLSKKAIFWGVATFVTMATLPLLGAIGIIEDQYSPSSAYPFLVVSTILALILAVLVRRTKLFGRD